MSTPSRNPHPPSFTSMLMRFVHRDPASAGQEVTSAVSGGSNPTRDASAAIYAHSDAVSLSYERALQRHSRYDHAPLTTTPSNPLPSQRDPLPELSSSLDAESLAVQEEALENPAFPLPDSFVESTSGNASYRYASSDAFTWQSSYRASQGNEDNPFADCKVEDDPSGPDQFGSDPFRPDPFSDDPFSDDPFSHDPFSDDQATDDQAENDELLEYPVLYQAAVDDDAFDSQASPSHLSAPDMASPASLRNASPLPPTPLPNSPLPNMDRHTLTQQLIEEARRNHSIELKRCTISVRLNQDEADLLRLRSAEAGMSVSAYLRSCVLEADSLRAQVKCALQELKARSADEQQTTRSFQTPEEQPLRSLSHGSRTYGAHDSLNDDSLHPDSVAATSSPRSGWLFALIRWLFPPRTRLAASAH